MAEILSAITKTLFFMLLFAVSFGKLGSFNWFFDLFSHWQLQYGIAIGVILIALIALRKWFFVMFAFFLFMFMLPDLTLMLGKTEVEDVNLYFINAHYTNPDNQGIIDSITAHNPKLISVVELSEDLADRIKEIGYKPAYEFFDEYDSMGFYYSKEVDGGRLVEAKVEDIFPYPIAHVKYYDTTIFTIHPFPGLTEELAKNQKTNFAQINQMIGEDKALFHLLVGDFNSSVYSQVFRNNFKQYKSRAKYTWNASNLFRLPIDYAMGDAQDLVYTVGEDVGSDHRPLLIDFTPARKGLFGS